MYPSGFCQQILPALDWDKLQFFSFARRWNLPFSLPPPPTSLLLKITALPCVYPAACVFLFV